jgi:hypothetical protein
MLMNSPILDLAIVLIFTYLLLSIISSTVYEAFLTIKRARNKMLKHALQKLFFDDEWKQITSTLLIDSPTIKVLKKNADSFPAYIPNSSFSAAIIGLIRNGSTDPVTIASIRAKLNEESSLIKGDARIALLNIIDNAQNDYAKFIEGLEKFYDDYMDRVSGWFKLKYQYVMFFISLIVTLVLNVDTIGIAKKLWYNPSKLHAAADVASTQFSNMSLGEDRQTITKVGTNGHNISINLVHHIDTTTISPDSAFKLLALQKATIENIVDSLNTSGIPMGWQNKEHIKQTFQLQPKLIINILGWLITTLAVFMGAPTWFDILNKLVNLRGAGKKPSLNTNNQKN